MPLLTAQDLMSIKRDRVLFEALDFTLQENQIIHLKGPNGAGKTSLMRILAGLSSPTEGQVFIKGVPVSEDESHFHKRSLYVGHKSGLSTNMSGIENTWFWCNQHGVDVTQSEIMSKLGMIGLSGLEDLPVAHLSAGQQRRVALLRLWLKTEAKLWFLDEPFTALDVQGIALIEKKMHEHVEAGGSVVVTSHQPLNEHAMKTEFELEYRF